MEVDKAIGVRMKEARERAKLTQTGFADLLGVTKQAVSSWENGRNDPPSSAIRLLAEKSGLTTDYLLSGVDGKTMEDQLVRLYRALPVALKHALVASANAMFAEVSPTPSAANPYPKKTRSTV